MDVGSVVEGSPDRCGGRYAPQRRPRGLRMVQDAARGSRGADLFWGHLRDQPRELRRRAAVRFFSGPGVWAASLRGTCVAAPKTLAQL